VLEGGLLRGETIRDYAHAWMDALRLAAAARVTAAYRPIRGGLPG